MDLVVDVGNTNIVLGIFENEKLTNRWRTATKVEQAKEEYQPVFYDFFKNYIKHSLTVESITICSVVPILTPVVSAILTQITNVAPIVLDSSYFSKISHRKKLPEGAGVDRLVNAYVAYERFQTGLIVIDLGTATTFDIISHKGEFLGGVIMPGLLLSFESLIANTQQLPAIRLTPPKCVIGNNTAESLQSGVIYGYTGMVDSMVDRIIKEHGSPLKIIATGGLAKLVEPISTKIDLVDGNLTLQGIFELSNIKPKITSKEKKSV